MTCVSDNGSNMVAGLNANGRLPCFCHTCELSIKKGCAVPEIHKVLRMASRVVGHFNRSTISSSKLTELQLAAGLKRQKLMRMVLTRWRSHRDMSLCVVKNKPALEQFFHENGKVVIDDMSVEGGKAKLFLESSDFRILDQFASILNTLAMASQILEGDRYPTMSLALTTLSKCMTSLRTSSKIVLSSGSAIDSDKLEP